MQRRSLWLILGWCFAAVVTLGLYLRWTEPSTATRVALTSVTSLVVFPLVALVVSAWRLAVPSLRLAAFGLSVVYLATFVSAASFIGCGTAASDDDLVILTHNVQWNAGQAEEVASIIAGSDADVIVLIEVWSAFMDVLEADTRLDQYRYRASQPFNGTIGLAVWSRLPIADARLERLDTVPVLRTTIEGPTGRFDLAAVHTSAPVSDDLVAAWDRQLDALGTYDTSTPAVLAGDFNATNDHQQFRALIERGWTNAHDVKGCGFDATWPTDRFIPFPLLRLDHVLVTDHFEVLGLEIGPDGGSDHSSVSATIRFRTDIEPAAG